MREVRKNLGRADARVSIVGPRAVHEERGGEWPGAARQRQRAAELERSGAPTRTSSSRNRLRSTYARRRRGSRDEQAPQPERVEIDRREALHDTVLELDLNDADLESILVRAIDERPRARLPESCGLCAPRGSTCDGVGGSLSSSKAATTAGQSLATSASIASLCVIDRAPRRRQQLRALRRALCRGLGGDTPDEDKRCPPHGQLTPLLLAGCVGATRPTVAIAGGVMPIEGDLGDHAPSWRTLRAGT